MKTDKRIKLKLYGRTWHRMSQALSSRTNTCRSSNHKTWALYTFSILSHSSMYFWTTSLSSALCSGKFSCSKFTRWTEAKDRICSLKDYFSGGCGLWYLRARLDTSLWLSWSYGTAMYTSSCFWNCTVIILCLSVSQLSSMWEQSNSWPSLSSPLQSLPS